MSNTIDNRIVEMQFDNKDFESNVQTSISTLDRLKNALKFENAGDGLSKIKSAIGNLTFGSAEQAIDGVGQKFSMLEEIASGALRRIGMMAADWGVNLAKSMTIDQVSAGFSKYEEKTASVQTIMAATGQSIDVVNEKIEKLNWFSDETSYSLTDMTGALSKFVSAGIDLDKSVTAIQGIANWAALSGVNASQASIAFYNISQAMGEGFMSSMNWKSLNLLNMSTETFKDTLAETAVEMGKLNEVSEGVYQTLDGTAEGTITELLSSDLSKKWFDNDLQMGIYERFGSYAEELNKYINSHEGIDTVSEAAEAIDAEVKAVMKTGKTYEEALDQLGYTLDEVSIKAFKTAQEAKTFTDMVDATKDASSSMWMKTFEYLFGNYEEAKELWTWWANTLYDAIAVFGEFRNGILDIWHNFSDWASLPETWVFDQEYWKELAEEKGWDHVLNAYELFWEGIKNITEMISTVFEAFKLAIDDTIGIGSIETWGETLARASMKFFTGTELLKNALSSKWDYDYNLSEENFREIGEACYETNDAFTALRWSARAIGGSLDIAGQAFGGLATNVKGALQDSEAELTGAGTGIVWKIAFMTSSIGHHIGTLASKLKADGSLTSLFVPLRNSLNDFIKWFTDGFQSLAEKFGFNWWDQWAEGSIPFFDKLTGLEDRFKAWCDSFAGSDKRVSDMLDDIFGYFGEVVDGVIAQLSAKFPRLTKLFRTAKKGVSDFVNGFVKGFKKVTGIDLSIPKLESMSEYMDFFGDKAGSLWEKIKEKFGKIKEVLAPWADAFLEVFDKVTEKAETFGEFLGTIAGYITEFVSAGLGAIGDLLGGSGQAVASALGGSDDSSGLLSTFFDAIGSGLEGVAGAAGSFWPVVKNLLSEMAKSIGAFFDGVHLENIISLIGEGGLVALIWNVSNLVGKFGGIGEAIKDAISGIGDALTAFSTKCKSETVKQVAESILILAAAMFVVALIPSDKIQQAQSAIIILGILMLAMLAMVQKIMTSATSLAAALQKKNPIKEIIGSLTSSLTGFLSTLAGGIKWKFIGDMIRDIGLSLLMIAGAAFIISKIDRGVFMQAVATVGVFVAGLILFTIYLAKLSVATFGSLSLVGIAGVFVGIGVGMALITGSIIFMAEALTGENASKITEAVGIIYEVMAHLMVGVLALYALSIFMSRLQLGNLLSPNLASSMAGVGAAFLGLGLAIVGVAYAVKLIAECKGDVTQAEIVVSVISLVLGVAVMISTLGLKNVKPTALYGLAVVIAALSSAIIAIAFSIKLISAIPTNMGPAVTVVIGIGVFLAVASAVLVKMFETKRAVGHTASFTQLAGLGIMIMEMAVAMVLIAAAIRLIMTATGEGEGGGKALAVMMGLTGVMLGMVALFAILKYVGDVNMKPLFMMIGALALLTIVIGILSAIDNPMQALANAGIILVIIVALSAICAILGALQGIVGPGATFLFMMGLGFAALGIGMLAMGAAVVVFAYGMKMLEEVDLEKVSEALSMLSSSFLEFLILLAFAAALGAGLNAFSSALMKIGIGVGIAVIAIILLCAVFVMMGDSADAAAQKVISILQALLEAFRNQVKPIVDLVMQILVEILAALASWLGPICNAVVYIVFAAIEAVAQALVDNMPIILNAFLLVLEAIATLIFQFSAWISKPITDAINAIITHINSMLGTNLGLLTWDMNYDDWQKEIHSNFDYFEDASNECKEKIESDVASTTSTLTGFGDVLSGLTGQTDTLTGSMTELANATNSVGKYGVEKDEDGTRHKILPEDMTATTEITAETTTTFKDTETGEESSDIGSFLQNKITGATGLQNFDLNTMLTGNVDMSNMLSGLGMSGDMSSLLEGSGFTEEDYNNYVAGLTGGGEEQTVEIPTTYILETQDVEGDAEVIESYAPVYQSAGEALGTALVTGLEDADIMGKMQLMMVRVSVAIRAKWNDMYTSGKFIAEGAIRGVLSQVGPAKDAGIQLGQAVVDGTNEGGGVGSPSWKTHMSGEFIAEGLVNALNENNKNAYNAGYKMGSYSAEGVSNAVKLASKALSEDFIEDTAMRPILDLSQIQNGARSASSLLNTNSVLQAKAAANSVKARISNLDLIGDLSNQIANGNASVAAAFGSFSGDISSLKDAMTGMGIYLDGKHMVGKLTSRIDSSLNQYNMHKARGN